MEQTPPLHRRRSLRLKDYDYTQSGAYFVTICTQGMVCLFGDVTDGVMVLNDAGRMVQSVWEALPQYAVGIDLDAFIVMPNHVHGIVVLTNDEDIGEGTRGQPRRVARTGGVIAGPENLDGGGEHDGKSARSEGLPAVVHRFKSYTTRQYATKVHAGEWPPFAGRLWHRNYYERVIRNERELAAIREYIMNNPLRWLLDRENPDR